MIDDRHLLTQSRQKDRVRCMLYGHVSLRLSTCFLRATPVSSRYCSTLSKATRTMSVEQPAWTIPARKVEEPVLKVYNSLTRTKVHPTMQFISIVFLRSTRQNSYPQMVVMSNGITVDLLSRMLHIWDMPGTSFLAFHQESNLQPMRRNYVTQDVLRRIVTDYFGYDVHFVMNITDIDDKVSSFSDSESTHSRPPDHPSSPPKFPSREVSKQADCADPRTSGYRLYSLDELRPVQSCGGSSRDRNARDRKGGRIMARTCRSFSR